MSVIVSLTIIMHIPSGMPLVVPVIALIVVAILPCGMAMWNPVNNNGIVL